ncbi:condensin-2 complex subunit H2-like isoform X2 [Battus philenor]
MNSQRLEQIVAELMKPISDVRRSFDTDLSALLEEYLTEAGLRVLDEGDGDGPMGDVIPNFAELALLLQHSACVYGRKVDFLYQHVLNVSDSLHNATTEAAENHEEPQATTPHSRRRRKPSTTEFVNIELEPCPTARRELDVTRPPPTLPRLYLQLEPRAPTVHDAQLTDYDGEPIGMLSDLHVTWRLQNGLLVEELDEPPSNDDLVGVTSRPLPLPELQAALDAGAPPGSPPRCSTPLPNNPCNGDLDGDHHDEEPRPMEMLDLSQILDTPLKKRKRKSDDRDDYMGPIKLIISEELKMKFETVQEFSLAEEWITKVVETRKKRVLAMRRKLLAHEPRPPNLGFLGWTTTEAAAARAAAKRADESDDDGFFEQSSLGDSLGDDSPSHTTLPQNTTITTIATESEDWNTWQTDVVKRATRNEGRVVDIQASAARLLQHVQAKGGDDPHELVSCAQLLNIAEDPTDVSRLFLATLFLANAGNIDMIQGAPLTLNSFSVRLVSTDERLYRAVATADEQFLR